MSKNIYQILENKRTLHFYFIILLSFILMFSLVCCGKKGPPIPPEMLPLPPVADLKANLSDNALELIWTVQTGKGVPAPDGFHIYRSKKSPEDSEKCPGCPDVFEKVSELATGFRLWGRTENRFNYREILEDGFVYRYKIMAYTYRGLTSEWSDTVEVMVKSSSFNSQN